ncbi:chaplin [Streptacidiphilus sp. P02-A3a]|uniref:chaplin n=1 Tax=Streptacidiphilus sp. P02-A3a TaxID=2704468 RepID=UPI0015FDF22D|nr:chaplin [Streptacidiphilus sp. P02-A3a]QMU72946.1 chaplin [Streptacidiphilus sp. P02-A3a]
MSRMRKAAVVAAMVGGIVFAGAGAASADAGAYGSANNSPGVLSGNVVQIPIDVNANVCGNSVNIIGLLNPAIGNRCSNDDGARGDHGYGRDHDGRWSQDGDHQDGDHDHGRGDDCC